MVTSFPELLRRKNRAIADKNTTNLALACKSLGDYYHESQQYAKALESYQEEAAAFERLGDRLETSKAHRMIGEMFMLLEQFDDALKHELIYLSKFFLSIVLSVWCFKALKVLYWHESVLNRPLETLK